MVNRNKFDWSWDQPSCVYDVSNKVSEWPMTGSLTQSLLGSARGWIPRVQCTCHPMTTPRGGSIHNFVFDKIVSKVCGLFLNNTCDLCLQWGCGTKSLDLDTQVEPWEHWLIKNLLTEKCFKASCGILLSMDMWSLKMIHMILIFSEFF